MVNIDIHLLSTLESHAELLPASAISGHEFALAQFLVELVSQFFSEL